MVTQPKAEEAASSLGVDASEDSQQCLSRGLWTLPSPLRSKLAQLAWIVVGELEHPSRVSCAGTRHWQCQRRPQSRLVASQALAPSGAKEKPVLATQWFVYASG